MTEIQLPWRDQKRKRRKARNAASFGETESQVKIEKKNFPDIPQTKSVGEKLSIDEVVFSSYTLFL